MGCGPRLAILLGDSDAAPDNLVFYLVGEDLPVLRNRYTDFLIKGFQHRIVGGNLTDDVIAIGQGVLAGGGDARRVGRDGHSHLSRSGSGAIDHHRVRAVVDDFKRNALQADVALGSGTGFAVQLLDGQAATHHVLSEVVHLQLVHIPGELGTVHRVGVDLCIQAVPLRGRELFYGDGAKRNSLKGAQVALGVRSQFLCHGLPAKLIAHLVHGPCEAGIALRSAAGLGVLLFQLESQSTRLVLHRK